MADKPEVSVDNGSTKPTQYQAGYAAAISDVFEFIDGVLSGGSSSLDTGEVRQFRVELEEAINAKGIV